MKKIVLGLTIIMVAVLAVSCTHSSPKAIAKAYVNALRDGDIEKAVDCFHFEGTEEEQTEARATMTALCEKSVKGFEKKGGIKSFKAGEVKEEGDKAIVYGSVTYGNGETDENEEIPTVKIDGKWYIDDNK